MSILHSASTSPTRVLGRTAIFVLFLASADAQSRYFVSKNGTTNAGQVDAVDNMLGVTSTFFAGNNEGVVLDVDGNLYLAGDVNAPTDPGSIRILNAIQNRASGDGFSTLQDRVIGGAGTALTWLVKPKGITLVHREGLLLVADNGDNTVKVFATGSSGDIAPMAMTTVPAAPWDLEYYPPDDRLFVALTDGTVAVFDAFVSGGFGVGGPDRIVVPADPTGSKVSINLHGIDYFPTGDSLVVSDVGLTTSDQGADFNRDGKLFILQGASTMSGNLVPALTFAGDNTLLGNPVDLIVDGRFAIIAEKANDRLLSFRWDLMGGNVPPGLSSAVIKPESVVRNLLLRDRKPDLTDLDRQEMLVSVLVTSNPAVANDPFQGVAAHLDPSLTLTLDTFDSDESLENVVVSSAGDAIETFDDGANTNGGIRVIHRLGLVGMRSNGLDLSRDRLIRGPTTGLVSPKGLDYASTRGLLFVAENNATTPGVLVFGSSASGDVAPLFRTDDLGAPGRRPWDVDYEPVQDRLFVANTDGTVAVFDQYVATQGTGGPDRVIVPFDPSGTSQISVNLHGIVHMRLGNRLILADVGSATNATDGQLFVIENALAADGPTAVKARVGGPASRLGNPVDIAMHGSTLYVAEKAQGLVLRFDGILNLSGIQNQPPSRMLAFPAPESLVLVTEFVGRAPFFP